MNSNTLELAESKLLILYIIDKIKLPISNMQLTEIILENNLLNYFTLQEYIFELVNSNFIEPLEKDNKTRLYITNDGIKILNMFMNRISKNKIELINKYLDNHIEKIKKQITITADYTIENKNNFLVNLKACENDLTLIDLKLSVASNNQARALCKKWKSNSSKLYKEIIDLLIDDI
ncbi:hypothetical protein CLTEP_05110 [Clostridium tepidiprofundi DSM 19306]|uniref:DUF4364 domain-containing protein n=1 Tax=Clostridium tepidiprofundi DSM 19306 TaxID=1121338 RepID=A0A151B7E4_9CLOT|nr:DUF4364 family protein [Clostridium tepidiprofundi]KYH35567.1 hypothetical protein CLTEP_05110 [Clostridium tepidiprofundi DSM 19306]